MPKTFENTPSEEKLPGKTTSSSQPNSDRPSVNSQESPPSRPPSPATPGRQTGVTGLLRDIFKRNASHPNLGDAEDETPAFIQDSGKTPASNIDGDILDDQTLAEVEANNTPFLMGDLLSENPPASPLPKGKIQPPDERAKKSRTASPAPKEQDSRENLDSPQKGINSFFTGILRNSSKKGSRPEDNQEDVIDDRLTNILPPPPEEPSDLSWEEKFLSSIIPSDQNQDESRQSADSAYDRDEKYYLSGIPKDEDEEGDYLFQEWTGFTKSIKNKADALPNETKFTPEIEEPDSSKLLPAHSVFDDDDEALFEEHNNDFKEKNSFLYVPDPNPDSISLDEMRQVVLENIQTNSSDPEKRKKRVSVDKSSRSFRNLKRREIVALSLLGILVIAIGISLTFILTRLSPQVVPPIATPTIIILDNAPSPVGIQITGGWYFPLSKNTIVDGRWKPKTAEWLEGSDIRRIVTLPWNKQLEAAIKTLSKGDEIELSFNNNERIVYQVEKVEQVDVDKTNPGNDLSPSLLIVLYDENSPNRWVITCLPKAN